MKTFPSEYEDHATALHKSAVAIAGILITITLLGMPAFLFLNGAALPLNLRKLSAFLVLGGAPLGLILISVVNASLGRRYRQYLLSAQVNKRGNAISSCSREETLKSMRHIRYDYHNERQSFKSAMAIIAILYVFPVVWLYLTYAPLAPYQVSLLVSFCFPLVWFGALWLRYSKRWQGSIALTIEGLRIEKDGHSELLPWDSVREIRSVKRGFLVRSDMTEIIIWDGISSPDVSWKSLRALFYLGESGSMTLIGQIKSMNPSIVHVEPVVSRDLQLPVFERIVATFMILAIILFVTVMIFTRPESVGR